MRLLCIMLVCVGVGTACDEPVGYRVSVRVLGSEAAFAGRSLSIENKAFPNPSLDDQAPLFFAPPAADAETGLIETSIVLCTDDMSRFLSTDFTIRIRGEDGVVTDAVLHRVACRLSFGEVGDLEFNQLVLHADGSLGTDFGAEPYVGAECLNDFSGRVPCESVDF